jgi:excisionase family DNA binding protein
VARRPAPISETEIAQAFTGPTGERFGPVLSPAQLAELTGLSVKTIYEWLSRGRLDGAVRRRGKHVLIWRDRALDLLFNGKKWKRT